MAKVELLKRNNLAVITVKNPPYNQLSSVVLGEFLPMLESIKDDSNIQVVIITGQGFFSAGADVKDIWGLVEMRDRDKAMALLAKANLVTDSVEALGKPTLAVIDGYCLGGGNELAMACTARIATDEAKLGQPEVNLGIMPGMGGTQRLFQLVEFEQAVQLVLSGMQISAADALRMGLVDRVVSKKDLFSEAKKFAQELVTEKPQRPSRSIDVSNLGTILSTDIFKMLVQSKSPDSVSSIIEAVKLGVLLPLAEGLKLEQRLFVDLVMKDSAKRGLAKFLKIDLEDKKVEKPISDSRARVDDSNHEEELKMLREMIREFAEQEVRPKISEMEQAGGIPRELFNKMGEVGLYGAPYPEEYGGSGLGKIGYCVVFEEVARVYPSLAVVVGAHMGLACGTIFLEGNEAQKQKYLKLAVEGKLMGAFALTEPEAGSDAGNIKTTAIKNDNGWVLNGVKQFITNGPDADFVVVIAQTDPFLKKDGLAAFIVETKWPGFRAGKAMHKAGIRASRTSELALDNVFVPDENLLGEVGKAFKMFMKTLNGGRLGLAAACVGGSKRAFELAFKYAHERQQFGMPIASNQFIQGYLARIRANIYFMEQAVYNAARMADQGKDIRLEAAMVKLLCSELNEWNTKYALLIHGGNGYMDEYEISHLWRDSLINLIFEGTNEIQQLLIYKELFINGGKID